MVVSEFFSEPLVNTFNVLFNMHVTVCTSFPYESLNKLAVPNNLIQLEEIVLTLPANKTKMKTASQTR